MEGWRGGACSSPFSLWWATFAPAPVLPSLTETLEKGNAYFLNLSSTPAITTLFVDVGNVLLTDSRGPTMRQHAGERFGFDFAQVAQRSQLVLEGYEEGKISLNEYLDWVVFYCERAFSREALTEFMFAQSQPPERTG